MDEQKKVTSNDPFRINTRDLKNCPCGLWITQSIKMLKEDSLPSFGHADLHIKRSAEAKQMCDALHNSEYGNNV